MVLVFVEVIEYMLLFVVYGVVVVFFGEGIVGGYGNDDLCVGFVSGVDGFVIVYLVLWFYMFDGVIRIGCVLVWLCVFFVFV